MTDPAHTTLDGDISSFAFNPEPNQDGLNQIDEMRVGISSASLSMVSHLCYALKTDTSPHGIT